jgi:phosphoribosylformylglycinamidine synthase
VTDDGFMSVKLNGQIVSRIPADSLVLGGSAPIYHRETKKPDYIDKLNSLDLSELSTSLNWNDSLIKLLSSPNLCHKGWVFEQYDSMVRTNTAIGPGSDAAILRLRKTDKALAMSTDCNARYCYLNPRLGAQIAVAEAARNIVCSGGKPLAITNCLNFGNPYKPEVYYCFAEAIAGMGESCIVFETPVTGGNVSFYNEDPERAVFPTPTIGMIGLVEHIDHIATQWFKEDGDIIFLIGENKEELGGSEYLRTIFDQTRGPVPQLDLQFEKRMHSALLGAIQAGTVRSAHDVADGGLAIALAECCITDRGHQIGATIELPDKIRPDCLLFGETQSRVIVSVGNSRLNEFERIMASTAVPFARIGRVGGRKLKINALIDQPLSVLSDAYYDAMPHFMEQVIV